MVGSRINFKITIIDTPGYGHTDGNSADVQITDQIRELFTAEGEKGIHFVDVICFVIQASNVRMVEQNAYIFKAVLSVFGKDIIENICMLLTFADVKPPAAIDLLKAADLPHDEYFCFNNSAIFADKNFNNDRSLLDWNMSHEGFSDLFDAVEKRSTKSLLLTKEVLIERKRLQITIANILDKLDVELQLEKSLENEILLMENSAREVEQNKDFTYKTTRKFCSKVPSENYNLNCSECRSTCHKKCWTFNFNVFIAWCEVFENGNCTQCKKNCNASRHRNEKELYEEKTMEVTITYQDMRQKYEIASEKKLSHEEVIAQKCKEMDEHDMYIEEMFCRIARSVQRLKEIALRNDPLSFDDYFEMLVKEQMSSEPFACQKILDLKKKLIEKAQQSSLTGKLRQALITYGEGITEFIFNGLYWN